ncbi:hypothetical protein ES703_53224 [subsurface metagenome]
MATPSRWYLTEYHHSWLDGELYITLSTDVPCHLWLRWTDKQTWIHEHEDTHRGYNWKWDPKYCFVEWETVEQDEPGDTLLHHFHFGGWAECQTRWWGFAGTISDQRSPSTSPIFHAHYQTFRSDESMRHIDLTDKEIASIIDHADGSITPAKLTHPFAFPQFPTTPLEAPTDDYQVANKKYVDDAAGNGGVWTELVHEAKSGLGPHEYNVDQYTVYKVMFTVERAAGGVSPHLRINGDTSSSYTSLYTRNNEAAGPTRCLQRDLDRFYQFSNPVSTGQPCSYTAEFMLSLKGWQGHFSASRDEPAGNVEISVGVHLWKVAVPITKFGVLDGGGAVFTNRMMIWGKNLPV